MSRAFLLTTRWILVSTSVKAPSTFSLQRRRLHEEGVLPLGEGLGVLGRDGPEVAQVRLVTDEHDHDVGVRVVLELPQPPLDVLEGDVPCDIVDDECAYRSTVIGTSDSSVPAEASQKQWQSVGTPLTE
jgi:hypothetical protein